jgi:hypothetical protein
MLLLRRCPPAEQVGQLGNVGGDPPGLVVAEQVPQRATEHATPYRIALNRAGLSLILWSGFADSVQLTTTKAKFY